MDDEMDYAYVMIMHEGEIKEKLDFDTWLKCFKYLVNLAITEEVSDTYLGLAQLLLIIDVYGTPAEEVIYESLCEQLVYQLEYINEQYNGYDDEEGLIF